MTDRKFLQMIQSRTARVAVGASAVRGRGNKGTVEAARTFVREIDLTAFGTTSGKAFAAALDRHTDALRLALPRTARHWGLARKVMNLFLLEALYTKYLNEAFELEQAEQFFEIPLDSYTGKRLVEAAGDELPGWPGVKHLTADVSARYQRVAEHNAKKFGFARVHLDAKWWSVERDNTANV